MRDWAVVVPSNRPDRLAEFEEAWRPVFGDRVDWYVVRDEPPWEGIPAHIPRQSDTIRSWGFFRAWDDGHKWILSMDDDVRPIWGPLGHLDRDVLGEYEAAFRRPWPVTPYFSVGSLTGTNLEMRGFAERWQARPAAFQYGGWDGVPDLDGATQLSHPSATSSFRRVVQPVPRGAALTCCAMNFAFDARYAEWAWQLAIHDSLFDRWGDIWSGLVQKRLCDAAGLAVLVNGAATVRHDRASDPVRNERVERPGHGPNHMLWEHLSSVEGASFLEVTDHLSAWVAGRMGPGSIRWLDHFRRSRDAWSALFR